MRIAFAVHWSFHTLLAVKDRMEIDQRLVKMESSATIFFFFWNHPTFLLLGRFNPFLADGYRADLSTD